MKTLQGQRAILVGGGGIGHGIVQALVEAGASVAVLDRSEDVAKNSAAAFPLQVIPLVCDASSEQGLEETMQAAMQQLGGLDILVYNAGIGQPPGSTLRQTTEMWQQVVDVNLKGAFIAARLAGKTFREQRSGAIVNIASVAGLVGTPAGNAYGVAKAGLVMLTKTLATDFARWGARVNCVCPGMIQTRLSEEQARLTPGGETVFTRRIPMGRFGLPAEIGTVVRFLVSSDASYVTGTVIPVDGGWTAHGAATDVPAVG